MRLRPCQQIYLGLADYSFSLLALLISTRYGFSVLAMIAAGFVELYRLKLVRDHGFQVGSIPQHRAVLSLKYVYIHVCLDMRHKSLYESQSGPEPICKWSIGIHRWIDGISLVRQPDRPIHLSRVTRMQQWTSPGQYRSLSTRWWGSQTCW